MQSKQFQRKIQNSTFLFIYIFFFICPYFLLSFDIFIWWVFLFFFLLLLLLHVGLILSFSIVLSLDFGVDNIKQLKMKYILCEHSILFILVFLWWSYFRVWVWVELLRQGNCVDFGKEWNEQGKKIVAAR